MSVSDSLKTYYDREWKRLQTDAKVFSKAYPEQAGHLHLDAPFGRDPNIDHLLQGCTYLAAQIHHHIDKTSDDMPTQLMMQLWPQLLQDVPSYSIAQFKMTSRMAPSQRVPAKTPLVSKPVGDEEISCRFETVNDLSVYPFDIHTVSIKHHQKAVSFVINAAFERPFLLNNIDQLFFYLSDDHVNACIFYHFLRQHCIKVELCVEGAVIHQELKINFPINTKNRAESDLISYQYLFDYFSFLQQYFILSLSGFSLMPDKLDAKQFEVVFHFDRPFPNFYSMGNTSITLNTALIVNTFSIDCEPIEYDHAHYQYPVCADRYHADVVRICSIESVQGIDRNTGSVTEYSPLSHLEDVLRPSYTVSRDQGNRAQYSVSCFNTVLSPQVLSIKATVCQGFYPKRFVPLNSLSLSASSMSHLCSATNILTPTQMLSPPIGLVSKHFIRYFTLNLESVLSADPLKALLRALNWSNDAQHKKRIDGILSITSELKSRVMRGAFCIVIDIQLQLKSDCFVSAGDMYLFGDVLHAFFKAKTSLGQMIALTVITYPEEYEFVWKPQCGIKHLL